MFEMYCKEWRVLSEGEVNDEDLYEYDSDDEVD